MTWDPRLWKCVNYPDIKLMSYLYGAELENVNKLTSEKNLESASS